MSSPRTLSAFRLHSGVDVDSTVAFSPYVLLKKKQAPFWCFYVVEQDWLSQRDRHRHVRLMAEFHYSPRSGNIETHYTDDTADTLVSKWLTTLQKMLKENPSHHKPSA